MASGVDTHTYFGGMKVISRNQAHAWFNKYHKFSKNSASLIIRHLNRYSEIISLKILTHVTALVMSTEPSSLSFDESESNSDCVFLSESIEECDAANSEILSSWEKSCHLRLKQQYPAGKGNARQFSITMGKKSPRPTMHIQNFFSDIILQKYHVDLHVVTHGKQQMLLVLQIKIVVEPHFIMEKKSMDHTKCAALIRN